MKVRIILTTIRLNKNFEGIIKIPETLNVFPDHLNTKKMSKNTDKMLPFIKMFVPDRYNAHELFYKMEKC